MFMFEKDRRMHDGAIVNLATTTCIYVYFRGSGKRLTAPIVAARVDGSRLGAMNQEERVSIAFPCQPDIQMIL